MSLSCTFLANCGLLLCSDHQALLFDAPCGLNSPFDGTDEATFVRMRALQTPYEGLMGLFFTHKHSDHYDRDRVSVIHAEQESLVVHTPQTVPEVVCVGDFIVRRYFVPHSGLEFTNVPHCCYLVEAEGKKVYVTGDADWMHPMHQSVLNAHNVDAAVWNPNFVTHDEGRDLLHSLPRNFINHMPILSEDKFGIGRKCRTSFVKYAKALTNCELIDVYPITREI